MSKVTIENSIIRSTFHWRENTNLDSLLPKMLSQSLWRGIWFFILTILNSLHPRKLQNLVEMKCLAILLFCYHLLLEKCGLPFEPFHPKIFETPPSLQGR